MIEEGLPYLSYETKVALEFVIGQVWLDEGKRANSIPDIDIIGDRRKVLPDNTEVYAYPHARGVAWGVNSGETGMNILRGLRLESGEDILVM